MNKPKIKAEITEAGFQAVCTVNSDLPQASIQSGNLARSQFSARGTFTFAGDAHRVARPVKRVTSEQKDGEKPSNRT